MSASKINGSRVSTLIGGVLFASIGFANYSYFGYVADSEEKGNGSCGIPSGQAKIVRDLNWLLGWFGIILVVVAITQMLFVKIPTPAVCGGLG